MTQWVKGRMYLPRANEGHTSFSEEQVERMERARRERLRQPSDDLAASRVAEVYGHATDDEIKEGIEWYRSAVDFCNYLAEEYPHLVSVDHAAGIVAALSPILSWEENLRRAEELVRDGRTYGLTRSIRDAEAILNGQHPNEVLFARGRQNHKVQAFYTNMSSPEEVGRVTVDRHGWAMIYGDREIGSVFLRPTETQYRWAEEIFRLVAAETPHLPHELQAITWVVWRKADLHKRAGQQVLELF